MAEAIRGAWSALLLGALVALASTSGAGAAARHGAVPPSARELIVVSSPSYQPAGALATFTTYERAGASARWEPVFPAWRAEIGAGGLRDARREGDRTTPTGAYSIGPTLYGNAPNPGGLHEPYRRLVCGDWWDEDPYSATYNEFVQQPCASRPPFAAWSEALWRETTAYPYLAVIDFNVDPVTGGADAPGSGIFLHAWVGQATDGCIALPLAELVRVLRWLRSSEHPYIEIGTTAELASAGAP